MSTTTTTTTTSTSTTTTTTTTTTTVPYVDGVMVGWGAISSSARGTSGGLLGALAVGGLSVLSTDSGPWGRQILLGTISEQQEEVQSLLNGLLVGDPVGGVQSIVVDQANVLRGSEALLGGLSSELSKVHSSLNEISATSLSRVWVGYNEIESTSYAEGISTLVTQIGEPAVVVPTVTFDIRLSGSPLKSVADRVESVRMSRDQGTVHDQITIVSSDYELFQECNPMDGAGTARLKFNVGTREVDFLLEDRSGDERQFTLWGRSLSALDDEPYADRVTVLLEEPTPASTVAADVLSSSLTWSTVDWNLPTGWAFDGSPIQCVQSIASAVGAVVRATEAGGVEVRRKYPVRPVDMQSTQADVDTDRMTNLMELSFSHDPGSGYDSVEVFGYTGDVTMPAMEVEEVDGQRLIGMDSYVRVYWADGKRPDALVSTLVSDGIITSLGATTTTAEREDLIFQNGVASTQKPVTNIVSYEWLGNSLGTVTKGSAANELKSSVTSWGVCRCTYTTTYERFLLSLHEVELLLMVLSVEDPLRFSSLLILTGTGSKQAPDISDGNITSEAAARERGTTWLDENKYSRVISTIRIPYDDAATDGNLVSITDANVGILGNAHIRSAEVVAEGPRLTVQMEVEQCLL